MATKVAAAGGGNWTTGATWVGGVAPLASDDAQLTGTSGNVTVDSGAVCRSLDSTGYTGTLTHTAGVTLTIGDATAGLGNIALKLVSGMTYTLGNTTSSISFVSTSVTQQTVTWAGKTPGNVTFNGAGGSWIMADGYTNTAALLTLTTGTLNLNGQTFSIAGISSGLSGTRTLTFGAANLTFATSWSPNTTNLTFNAGTSDITLTGNNATFVGGGLTYNNVSFTGSGPTISGANTFANLTRTGSAVRTDVWSFGANQTITGTLTINGNSATNRLFVQSNTLGTARTLTAAIVSVTNADFMDITGAGAGSWNLAAITGGSGDCQGNSGITFTTPATQTHTTSAGGNWSDVTKWTSRVPLPQDDVIVDVNTTGTLTADMPRVGKDLTFTGFTGVFARTVNIQNFGSVVFASGMSVTASSVHYFYGRGTRTLTFNGISVGPIGARGVGTYTFQDTCRCTGLYAFDSATLNANDKDVFCDQVQVNATLNMGSGTWDVSGTGTVWYALTGSVINASTSTIVLSGVSAASRTFNIDIPTTFNNLTYTVAGSTGALILAFGVGTFNDVTIGEGRTLTLPASLSTPVLGTFSVNGTAALPTTLNSDSSGTPATLSKASGTVAVNYLSIKDSTATGGATFRALNSTSVSGNTGWTFVPTSGDTILTPYNDVSINSWTDNSAGTTNLYTKIDETVADDADYIQSPAAPTTAQYYETALESYADPGLSTGHIVHYRYQKNVAAGGQNLDVYLRQGAMPELLTVNQQSLETDTTGWAANSNCSIARSTAQAFSGVASLAMTATASGDMVATTPIGMLGFLLDGALGQPVTLVCQGRAATTGRTVHVTYSSYDGSGSSVGGQSTTVADVVGSWTNVGAGAVNAQSSGVYGSLQIWVVGAAAGEVHYFDAMSVIATYLATWRQTPLSTWTQQDQTLTALQADQITDYSDLRLRFVPSTGTSDQVPTYVADRATANSNSVVTTVDLVLTSLTVGNYLIVRAAGDNSGSSGAARTFTPSNFSGTAMGTHTEYQQLNDPGAASAGVQCDVSVIKIAATSGTIRLTYSGSVVAAVVAEEWSGIDGTTPVVGTPVKANGVASLNLASLTDSSIAAGNVAYGAMAVEGPTSDTYTQDADSTRGTWATVTKLGTSNATADTNMTIYGGYKAVISAGAQTYDPTISVARDSAGIILELAAAPATIRTQVSWANLELPAVTAIPRAIRRYLQAVGRAGLR